MRPAVFAVVFWGSVSLVAGRADDSSGGPPRSRIQSVSEIAAAERAAPWAGIVTVRAPAVLREQFRLERGAGLVVESVSPGSVAERAGLKRHDVLVSIDGQLLLLPEQFVTLLEASGDGSPLECRVLRGGVEKTVSLRQVTPISKATAGLLKPTESSLALVPRTSPTAVATITQLPDGSLQQRDTSYVVRLTRDAERRLIIRDARGRTLFNGPIDTPEQRSLVPPEVRDRVEGLERLVAQRQALEDPGDTGPSKKSQARIGALDITPVEIR